jgi:hypothetical protein
MLDLPVSHGGKPGEHVTQVGMGIDAADNFRAWWKLFEDDVCMRDMEFCRRLHPKLQDIETWIRVAGYDGRPKPLLKTFVDAVTKRPQL